MIEKMKNVTVVCTASQKASLLNTLRDLGILHLSEKHQAESVYTERFTLLSKNLSSLNDYVTDETKEGDLLSDEAFESLNQEVTEALKQKTDLTQKRSSCIIEAEKLASWGNFDPSEIRALSEQGYDLHFYRLETKVLNQLKEDENVRFVRLSQVDKMEAVAVFGTLPPTVSANEFTLPQEGLSQLKAEADACEKGIASCEETLKNAAQYTASYNDQLLKTQNNVEYSAVSETAESEDGLVWLTGYIPEADVQVFTEAMQKNGWAWCTDDIADDDEKVPTKIRYNKVTALMQPVFDILGTVPGYREYDISFWFLCFFSIFTAMIIGDAGYGVIFLIIAIVLNVKMKKANNVVWLLYVLSASTIIWGSMTGTWFGLEGAMKVPFLKALVIPQIANYPEYFNVTTTQAQNGVMKLSFSIGVIQLLLACFMNIRRKIPAKDLSWVADLGWAFSIGSLYFLVLYLVIGQQANLKLLAGIVITGFLLVVLFGGMAPDKTFAQGLKSGLANAFTVFLNTISAFGNVMSYIRLFAVGMASLAIAQSFNNMASGFSGILVIAAALIMIVGHLLNIVMALLSVVVHGVRLNLLEFSGQLGMEWSGTAYDPFRKLDKIKK